MYANSKPGDQEDVRMTFLLVRAITVLKFLHRCFLFLVNYARMKADVAMKALPVLVLVSFTLQDANVILSD